MCVVAHTSRHLSFHAASGLRRSHHLLTDPVDHRRALRLPAQQPTRALATYAAVRAESIRRHFVAPFLFRFFERPVLRLAHVERVSDGGRHVAEHRFAAFDEIERAGRRLFQREAIELDDIVDMHVRPDVAAATHMTHNAAFLRLTQETRQLYALGARYGAMSIDQGVAQY